MQKINIEKIKNNQEKRSELLKNKLPGLVSGSQAHKIAKEQLLYRLLQEQENVAKALIIKAKSGDIQAIKEFFDRLYGKPKETIDFGGEVKFSLKALAEERSKLQAKLVDNLLVEIDQDTVIETNGH